MSDIIEPSAKPKPTWKNLGVRIVSALILIAICLAPFYFGGPLWAVLIVLLGARLIWEWVHISDPTPSKLSYIIPILGVVICVTYIYLGAPVSAFIAALFITVFAMIERAPRSGGLWSGLGFLYICVPAMLIVSLRGNEIGFSAPGFLILIFLIAIVAAADTGAYFGGSYFKGPKIAPKLSPKKTWSGFVSGFIAGSVMGAVCAFFSGFPPFTGALLAMPVVILSVLGDFLESGLKRRLEVKDTGDLLPGHGGLLDRLDSLLMVVVGVSIVLFFAPGLWPL